MVKVHLYFLYVTDSYIFNKRRFLSDPVLVEQKAYPDQKGWFLPSNNNKILSCTTEHLHDICTIQLINSSPKGFSLRRYHSIGFSGYCYSIDHNNNNTSWHIWVAFKIRESLWSSQCLKNIHILCLLKMDRWRLRRSSLILGKEIWDLRHTYPL